MKFILFLSIVIVAGASVPMRYSDHTEKLVTQVPMSGYFTDANDGLEDTDTWANDSSLRCLIDRFCESGGLINVRLGDKRLVFFPVRGEPLFALCDSARNDTLVT